MMIAYSKVGKIEFSPISHRLWLGSTEGKTKSAA
jgi:hypothetical protein